MARVAFINRINEKHHDLAKKIADTGVMVYVPKQGFDENGFVFFFYDTILNKKDLSKKPPSIKGITFKKLNDESFFVKSKDKEE